MVKQGMAERFWVWIIEDGYWYRVPEEHIIIIIIINFVQKTGLHC